MDRERVQGPKRVPGLLQGELGSQNATLGEELGKAQHACQALGLELVPHLGQFGVGAGSLGYRFSPRLADVGDARLWRLESLRQLWPVSASTAS